MPVTLATGLSLKASVSVIPFFLVSCICIQLVSALSEYLIRSGKGTLYTCEKLRNAFGLCLFPTYDTVQQRCRLVNGRPVRRGSRWAVKERRVVFWKLQPLTLTRLLYGIQQPRPQPANHPELRGFTTARIRPKHSS